MEARTAESSKDEALTESNPSSECNHPDGHHWRDQGDHETCFQCGSRRPAESNPSKRLLARLRYEWRWWSLVLWGKR